MAGIDGTVVEETTRYRDEPGARVLDLRTCGVPFVAVLSKRECNRTASGPRLHVHPGCIEIVYCVRGELAFETPHGIIEFRPGNVFTSRADEPHRMKSNPKGLFVYRVLVELPRGKSEFPGLSRAESKWLAASLLALPRCYTVAGRAVRAAFERCFAAYDIDGGLRARRTFALRQTVYDLLLTLVAGAENDVTGKGGPDVSAWARRMEEKPQADYPSDEMSQASGLSQNVFSRLFKEVTGLPPQAYLKVCRIRQAERWLKEGRKSIPSIAHALGFCSPQYFATVFKSVTGISPRAFRKG